MHLTHRNAPPLLPKSNALNHPFLRSRGLVSRPVSVHRGGGRMRGRTERKRRIWSDRNRQDRVAEQVCLVHMGVILRPPLRMSKSRGGSPPLGFPPSIYMSKYQDVYRCTSEVGERAYILPLPDMLSPVSAVESSVLFNATSCNAVLCRNPPAGRPPDTPPLR